MNTSETTTAQRHTVKSRIISKVALRHKGKIKVGIPRALLYYKFYKLWTTFFKELGAEVIAVSYTHLTLPTN